MGRQVASFNAGSTQSPSPLVIQVIKKMAGGSQSRLVMCDDGKIYVLKIHPNPQGPCVLANEALGASLMEDLGFVTPKWRQLRINSKSLSIFPELVMARIDGITLRLRSSRFGSNI